MPVFSSSPGCGWMSAVSRLSLTSIVCAVLLHLIPAVAQADPAGEGDPPPDREMWINEITGEEMDPADFEINPEYLPPLRIDTTLRSIVYEVYRKEDGVKVAEMYACPITRTDPSRGIPALNLFKTFINIYGQDETLDILGAALAHRNPPQQMENIASFQLQFIHELCAACADLNDADIRMPEVVRRGDTTILNGKESRLIILHPRNIPVIAAQILPAGFDDDFSNMLGFMGDFGARDFESPGGEAESAYSPLADDVDGEQEILSLYDPAVPLSAARRLSEYTLRLRRSGEVSSHLAVPAWSRIDEAAGMPAIDLLDYMLYAAEQDPGFAGLAREMSGWSLPGGFTGKIPSAQLAIIHVECDNSRNDDLPYIINMGDMTSLSGENYEMLIIHPRNIPLLALLVEPTGSDEADCFGTVLCAYGSLTRLEDFERLD